MDGILRGATSRSRNVALRVFYYARSSARVMVTVRVEPLPYTMHAQQRFVVTSGEEGVLMSGLCGGPGWVIHNLKFKQQLKQSNKQLKTKH